VLVQLYLVGTRGRFRSGDPARDEGLAWPYPDSRCHARVVGLSAMPLTRGDVMKFFAKVDLPRSNTDVHQDVAGEKIGKVRGNAIRREIFPYLRLKATSPVALFDRNFEQNQKTAITTLSPAGGDDGTVLLAVSERIYDTELGRLDGFITRSGFVLGAGGIFGALVVAAGQLGLMHTKDDSFGIAAWIALILFYVALIYLGASLIIALGVQGLARTYRRVVGPFDLSHSIGTNQRDGNIELAKVHLECAVENYSQNSKMSVLLYASQTCLRNAVIAIILTGMLSPWALSTGTTGNVSAHYFNSSSTGIT
jgi:hypothetical protein